MSRATPRRILALWIAGTLLLGASVFWSVYVLWPGTIPGGGPRHVLPPVRLNQEAHDFLDALPRLGHESGIQSGGTSPRMIIPKLELDQPIVEAPLKQDGWFIDGLESRITHLEGTDAPGGKGNAAFAGHVSLDDNSPGPLVHIDRLVPGDVILVRFGQQTFHYEVVSQQQVGEDRLEVVYPTETPTLTLITCASWSWLDGRYTSRQVVTARLIEVVRT